MTDLSAVADQLAIGTRLGPYEIVGFIGQGGMGQVYRARDTRLDRIVAVKILPGDSSGDVRRRERFMREAWMLSSLNHPHISAIHDIGEHEGRAFLVMEFADGEPLDVRLARRPLGVTSAVTLGSQIADALDAAHRRGFVHRDLKPSNVIITPAGVKLVDFGIASLWSEPLDPVDQSMATTASDAASVPGTTAYISPEQLEGRPADPRSDLFALGIVLYEMLAGRRPFAATTRAGLIAAILEKAPEPLLLPAGPPHAALERVVMKCLEKDPDARWQTARDLSSELAWILQQQSRDSPVPAQMKKRSWSQAAIAALAVAAVVAAGFVWFRADAARPSSVVRFIITPPAGVVTAGTAAFALSPDGKHLALVGSSRGGPSLLWVQALDSYSARPVDGTDDAWHPFWSPDGRSVGFFAGGKLKAATVDGAVRTLADVPQAGRASHGMWGRDDIIFNAGSLLWRVPADGGTPIEMALGPGLPPESSLFPSDFLPDGRHFVFRAAGVPAGTPNSFIGSIDGGPVAPLITTDSQIRYVDPGYLLYMRNGDLVMQAFDPRARTVGGQPVHVPEPVSLSTRLGRAIFSSARSDVLAYEAEATPTELVWYDRFGRRLGVLGAPGLYTNPALSPDGRRAAVTRFDQSVDSSDIWIVDDILGERALTATTASEDYPIWSANGLRVIYASDSPGRMRMYEKPADSPASTADAVPVNDTASATDDNWPLDWAPHGALVVFQGANAGIPRRLLALHTSGPDHRVIPVPSTSASTGVLQEEAQAQVSPDGRWIAYTADLGRSPQVFVKAFPSGASVTQISTAGGFEPKWRGDGGELFYIAPDRTIMSAGLQCYMTCDATPPQPLFRVAALGAPLRKGAIRNEYTVTRDGQRFLVNEPVDGTSAYGIRIVVNWQAGVLR